MSQPVIDIERVVREVLAELGAAQKGEGGRGKGSEGWTLQCPVRLSRAQGSGFRVQILPETKSPSPPIRNPPSFPLASWSSLLAWLR